MPHCGQLRTLGKAEMDRVTVGYGLPDVFPVYGIPVDDFRFIAKRLPGFLAVARQYPDRVAPFKQSMRHRLAQQAGRS